MTSCEGAVVKTNFLFKVIVFVKPEAVSITTLLALQSGAATSENSVQFGPMINFTLSM